MMVNDVVVTVDGLSDITEAEIAQYIGYVEDQTKEKVNELIEGMIRRVGGEKA